MDVPFIDLKLQYQSLKSDIDSAIQAVIDSTAFSGGPFVERFEQHFAKEHDSRFCAGVSSGTAALHVALMALEIGVGDEVIVPANTFFATAEAVSLAGARPVFVDCEERYFNIDPAGIEQAISPRTRAVIAVNLYGQPAQLTAIKAMTDRHGLVLIEDCAQSHLARLQGRYTGTFGEVGCFSFYPGKNLGAYGEAGAVLTQNEELYNRIRALRDHGALRKYHHDFVGHNYRMEGIQAALLDVKLRHLRAWTAARQQAAAWYRTSLNGVEALLLPGEMPGADHVYHLFVVRTTQRDALQTFLETQSIHTGIHYPVPCHLQKAYAAISRGIGSLPVAERCAAEVLSLPMFAEITKEQVGFVADSIGRFFRACP